MQAAYPYEHGQLLIDVREPAGPPRTLPGIATIGWGPDDILWRWSGQSLEWVDPATGERTWKWTRHSQEILSVLLEHGGLPIAADGSGVVVPPLEGAVGGRPRRGWSVIGVDGRLMPVNGWPGVFDPHGNRQYGSGGGRLVICGHDPVSASYCSPGWPPGSVFTPSTGSGTAGWGGARPPDEFVRAARWAVEDGVWLLVDRPRDGRTLGLVRMASDTSETEGPAFAVSPRGSIDFAGLAPDDSLIGIEWLDDAGYSTALVDIGSGRTFLHRGQLAGFVSASESSTWATSAATDADGRLLPVQPEPGIVGYPPLISQSEQLAGIMPEPALLVHEEPARTDPPGTPTQAQLGPLVLDEGFDISLTCSGPGVVSYRIVGGHEDPVVVSCLDGTADIRGSPGAAGTLELVVTADTATAWRLVVVDPPPEGL
jgi:hypothetical protein